MNDLNDIARFFGRLGNVTTIAAKTDILENASADCWNALIWLLNPYVVTGISTKKLSKNLPGLPPPQHFKDVCDYLTTHNTGTDKDIAVVQSYINAHSDHHDFLEKFFAKTLKVGVDHKLANKVRPGSVPHFDVMLGTPLDKCEDTTTHGATMYVSQKLNGTRIVYTHGKLYTRSGREYTGLEHIVKALELLVEDLRATYSGKWQGDWTFDGELIYKDKALNDSECFQKGTGIANSKDKDKSMLRMVIFDCLPTREFDQGKSTETYCKRLARLNDIAWVISNGPKYAGKVEVVYRFGVTNSMKIVHEYLDKAEKLGYEGVMINMDTPYECKRTKNLVKCKVFYDMELLCVGVERGTNKYADTLGCLVCKMGENIVRVGSGFSDAQRYAFFHDQDSIVGKQVTVKYKEITHDKDGNESLQFPVFVGVRMDWDK